MINDPLPDSRTEIQPYLRDFQTAVQPYLKDWKSIDLRVLAHRAIDNEWDFDTIIAILDHQKESTTTRTDLPESTDLFVVHERWSIDRLGELLRSISDSKLTVGGKAVRVARYDGKRWQPVFAQSPTVWSRQASRLEFGIDFASFVTRIWEGIQPVTLRRNDIAKSIDEEVRSFDPPWDGLGDLRRNFVGLHGTVGWGITSAMFDIVAPLSVRIVYPINSNGTLASIRVEKAHDSLGQRVGVSLIGRQADGSFLRRRANPNKTGNELGMSVDMENLPARTTVILTYGDVEVDRTELLTLANPRLAVFLELADDLDRLHSLLLTTRGREFESCFTVLLQLLGFSPAHYGGTSLEGPDVVAFPMGGDWLFVVECTEREPDVGNKLSKLATRTKEINQALAGYVVYPVIVTSLSRAVLNQTDLEKAKKEKISVVTRDEFQALLDLALEIPELVKARDYFLSLIPGVYFRIFERERGR